MERRLEIVDAGRLRYEQALRLQQDLLARRLDRAVSDTLMLVEHPPTVTLGRRAGAQDLLLPEAYFAAHGIDLCHIERGGQATAHEPGQLVAYPIVELVEKDLHKYIRDVIEVAAELLREYGLVPELKAGEPGLWVNGAKIASIGVAVRKWVTFHGLALNVNNDLQTFARIVPCGKPGERLTSMRRELRDELDLEQIKRRFTELFRKRFGYAEGPGRRHPSWIKLKAADSQAVQQVEELVSGLQLETVCQSARCPNLGECFSRGTATFLILGNTCTRRCRFCAVEHGTPPPVDADEPLRVAMAAEKLALGYVVVTSVTRDDLPDGGAGHFSRTIEALRQRLPTAKVEVLVPDFNGSREALDTVARTRPDMFNHNLETVPRLYAQVRPGADYRRSLDLLQAAAATGLPVKSGLMLGLGEEPTEVEQTLRDLRDAGCTHLTLGQYLAPTAGHLPVKRYVPPEEFMQWEAFARRIGYIEVKAGPLVRSSYRADQGNFRKEMSDSQSFSLTG